MVHNHSPAGQNQPSGKMFTGPGAEEGSLSLMPGAEQTILNLRGYTGDRAFMQTVQEVAGLDLPTRVTRVTRGQGLTALCLGPNEWLVLAPRSAYGVLYNGLKSKFEKSCSGSVVDVSHNYKTFLLAGDASTDVLNRGCTLDLHPRVFTKDTCAQTWLARAPILIYGLEPGPGFAIMVRNSYAPYCGNWLDQLCKYLGGTAPD